MKNKRMPLFMLVLFLMSSIGIAIVAFPMNDNSIKSNITENLNETPQQENTPHIVIKEDHKNSGTEYIEKVSEGSLVNVMIQGIEIVEREDELKISFIGFKDEISKFMEKFEINYNDDYYELTLYNLWEGLPEDSILVQPRMVSDVSGSKFIDQWYKTILLGDSVVGYGIRFREDIDYLIEESTNPGTITVSITKALNPRSKIYTLKSTSDNLFNSRKHYEDTISVYHTYLDEKPTMRVLKDHEGFFNCIFSSENKEEVEILRVELLNYYEKYADERYEQEQTYYTLVIENH